MAPTETNQVETNDAPTNGDDEAAKETSCDSNDFVIREGFPALRLPGGKSPWIDGDEPLPRHKFWTTSHGPALLFPSSSLLESLIHDCETVFSARCRESDEAYSAGVTYFLPCLMKPRCALEELALSIFRKHTENCLADGVMIPEQSGAEWWTLVLDDEKDEKKNHEDTNDDAPLGGEDDDDDEVGLHFDADYGLEDQAPNLLIHPRVATVTYLTDYGAPTVVLDKRSHRPDQQMSDVLGGDIRKGWLSHPRVGRHVAFDGRLLHGAPATFFPPQDVGCDTKRRGEDARPAKRVKQERKRRITFLVNIWINHCPLDPEPIDDDLCEQLKTDFHKSEGGSAEKDSGTTDPGTATCAFTWNDNKDNPIDFNMPPACPKISLTASSSDPAGSEEFVLCSHHVTAKYGAAMKDFHDATKLGDLVELELGEGVLTLEVGNAVSASDEDEEDDEEDEGNNNCENHEQQ